MALAEWRTWRTLVVLIGLAAIALALWPRRGTRPLGNVATVPELEALMERLVASGTPPGMSLVVVKNGDVVYAKGYGWADGPRRIAATPQTVYHWFSCTKIATAIAILQLRERGALQLDDPVTKYLPFFTVHTPSALGSQVTIRHLLTHSSGLPDAGWRIIGWIHHDNEPAVNQTAMLQRVLPHYVNLAFEPGDHAEYTNIGYMVLGAIIESVTGRTYEDYVRQEILLPLAMQHTDFVYKTSMASDEAAGSHPLLHSWSVAIPFLAGSYVREVTAGRVWFKRFYNDQTPPTGLIGSAADAARLLSALTNGGQLQGRRILSQESVTAMVREGYVDGREDDRRINRRQGIGWQIYRDRDRLMIRHEGGGLGFSSVLQLYPDEGLGLALFTNDVTCQASGVVSLAAGLNW